MDKKLLLAVEQILETAPSSESALERLEGIKVVCKDKAKSFVETIQTLIKESGDQISLVKLMKEGLEQADQQEAELSAEDAARYQTNRHWFRVS
jgi:hypothetical protein